MLLPDAQKKPFPFLFVISLLAVIAVGTFASFYVYRQVDEAGRAHILDRANTVARLLPATEVAMLSGSEADLGTAPYEHIKELLEDVRSVNADVRFAYLGTVNADGDFFFYADSEPTDSEDYSPPGQVYDEATDAMYAILDDGIPRAEGPDRDRWGTWISAYAPIYDTDGNVIAMLGLDLPADAFLSDLYVYSLLPAVVALSVLLFIIAGELSRRRERKIFEEKEEFLSIASHEIRTPLAGVRWGLEHVLRKGGLEGDERTMASLMHDTTVTLVARLNSLLDVRSLEHHAERAFRKDVIDIESFLKEAASTLMLPAQEREVTIELPATGSATLTADPQLMRHVFQNLISNAVKYTRPGTTVNVEYEHAGDCSIFRIRDEGEGIPDGERVEIFSGYKRGERARKGQEVGTGIGLYMARKAVAMHKGTIEVASETGKGTTFTVRIPD